jgi:glycine/D-amino acid oxidase-like deaminating enzyme
VPGRDGLWIAAGMNGFGVMRGPAVGAAVARWIAGDDAKAVPADCRSGRVAWSGLPSFPIRPGYTL